MTHTKEKPQQIDDFCDAHDACEMLHISRKTLSRIVKKGIIKQYSFPGFRQRYFRVSELTSSLVQSQI